VQPSRFDLGEVLTPFRIAAVYVVLGGAWILFSDRLLDLLVADQPLYVALQTAKGWLFVLASGVLVFALVRSRERRLATANERTERALRQAGVLHRVLRHNLRNVCNVIQGNTELLAEADGGSRMETECTEAVREQTERLVELSEKTQVLQDVLQGPTEATDQDVAALLSDHVERLRQDQPGVTVDADLPSSAVVRADERLPEALGEVLANAVEHHDTGDLHLDVAVEHALDGSVLVDVADDGPGIPQMERDVLDAGIERPLFHSEGLGLWLVRSVVEASEGEVSIVDNEPRGSIVRLRLPSGGDLTGPAGPAPP
jgi:two-component system OmpR family sensor kinase